VHPQNIAFADTEIKQFVDTWHNTAPAFVEYMESEWFTDNKLLKLVRLSVDSSDGEAFVIPKTTSAIESYHSHLKGGELRCKYVTHTLHRLPPPARSVVAWRSRLRSTQEAPAWPQSRLAYYSAHDQGRHAL